MSSDRDPEAVEVRRKRPLAQESGCKIDAPPGLSHSETSPGELDRAMAGYHRLAIRYHASWRDWYYEIACPADLRIGDALPVREDRVTATDVQAVIDTIIEYENGHAETVYEDLAVAICKALLGGDS